MKSVGELGRFGPISILCDSNTMYVEGEGNKSPYKRYNVFVKKYSKEKAAFLNDEGVIRGISQMDTTEYDNFDDKSLAQHIKSYMHKKQFYYENGTE